MINDNARHMVCGTLDSSQAQKVYVDGVLDGSKSTGLTGMSTRFNSVQIGARSTTFTQNFFSGTIDEVSIYNWPLSQAEITAIYNVGVLA